MPTTQQLYEIFQFYQQNHLSNPHSRGALGHNTMQWIQRSKELIWDYFHCTQEDYDIIFTSGIVYRLTLFYVY